jgi:hypothetical protein
MSNVMDFADVWENAVDIGTGTGIWAMYVPIPCEWMIGSG